MIHAEKKHQMHYLTIDKNKTIEELQKRFSNCFPYLKIEFFKENIQKNLSNSKNKVVQPSALVCDLQDKIRIGKIKFDRSTKVREIENDFLQNFGLYMQVFRKSGNVWLVTTSTDDWTLEQQNEEGRSIAEYLNT